MRITARKQGVTLRLRPQDDGPQRHRGTEIRSARCRHQRVARRPALPADPARPEERLERKHSRTWRLCSSRSSRRAAAARRRAARSARSLGVSVACQPGGCALARTGFPDRVRPRTVRRSTCSAGARAFQASDHPRRSAKADDPLAWRLISSRPINTATACSRRRVSIWPFPAFRVGEDLGRVAVAHQRAWVSVYSKTGETATVTI